jgi:serpin B
MEFEQKATKAAKPKRSSFSSFASVNLYLNVWNSGAKGSNVDKNASPSSDADSFVADNTAFALDLYGQLRTEPGNLFFSPHSISRALAMTYAGARGETETQIAKALHFNLPQEKLHAAFAALQTSLEQVPRLGNVQLLVANSLWPAKGLPVRKEFLSQIERAYSTRLTPLDFGETEAARQTINRWVAEQTRGKIREFFQSGLLDPLSLLVLANAIYFKGDWAEQFNSERTQLQPFHLTSASQVTTPMMRQRKQKCHYHEDAEVQVLEMPYQGGRLSMAVLLPRQVDALAELEQGMTVAKLKTWIANLKTKEVEVCFPKFKTSSEFRLDDKLKALGMADAFGATADLTGMFENPGSFISAAVHQAFVEVNEQGTEASALSILFVSMGVTPIFRADHPFLFLIRDKRTGCVLFLGRLVNPLQTRSP